MKQILLSLLLAASASAQSALAPPQLGFVLDGKTSLRALLGFPGNWVLGRTVNAGVLSSAWSSTYGLVKTSSSVLVLDRAGNLVSALDAGSGPALFAFHASGTPALAFMPQSGVLLAWSNDHFKPVSVHPDVLRGTPLAIGDGDFDRPRFIVQRPDGIWQIEVSNRTGQLEAQAALPGIAPPVLLDSSGALFHADQTALVMRAPDGIERRIELGVAMAEIRPLGNGWIHVVGQDSSRQFIVHVSAGKSSVSQLPEIQ